MVDLKIPKSVSSQCFTVIPHRQIEATVRGKMSRDKTQKSKSNSSSLSQTNDISDAVACTAGISSKLAYLSNNGHF